MDRREYERREASRKTIHSSKLNCDSQCEYESVIKKLSSRTNNKVIAYHRISRGSNRKLWYWKEILLKIAKDQGIEIQKDKNGTPLVFVEVKSGKPSSLDNRLELDKAIEAAKQYGVPIWALTPSRLLRNEDFHPIFNKDLKPTQVELDNFLDTNGSRSIDFVCSVDPSIPLEEDEAYITTLACRYYMKKPKRRGYCKRRRSQWKDTAVQMLRKGMSTHKVAKEVSDKSGYSISAMTICRWNKETEAVIS